MLPSRIRNPKAKAGQPISLKPEDIEAILRKKLPTSPAFWEVTVGKSCNVNYPVLRCCRLCWKARLFQKSYKRIYPQGWMTAHVTGYVSPVNKRDIEEPDLRYLPETRIGRTGIERKIDQIYAAYSGLNGWR